MNEKRNPAESEGIHLYRLHVWGQLTLIPMTAFFIATAWLLPSVPKPMSAKSCLTQAAAAPNFNANTNSTSTANRAEARRRASKVREAAEVTRAQYTPGWTL